MSPALTVEGLVAEVEARARRGTSIERLSAAAALAAEVREVGDQLLERYVQAARADDRSWAQIGEALGVSKQAVQQRFVAAPTEPTDWPQHFSEPARGVVAAALVEARAFGHRYLGTEHLLLALAVDRGLAGAALERLDVDANSVRDRIRTLIGTGHSSETATLGITPRTKRVFDAARQEARRLGHRCADSEHLLLAIGEADGVAGQILAELGAGEGKVREHLAELLAGEAPELAAKLRSPGRRRLRSARR